MSVPALLAIANRTTHQPAMLNFTPSIEMVAVAERARDPRRRRKPVAVLRHAAVHRDRRGIDRLPIDRVEVQGPPLEAPNGNGRDVRPDRHAIEAVGGGLGRLDVGARGVGEEVSAAHDERAQAGDRERRACGDWMPAARSVR